MATLAIRASRGWLGPGRTADDVVASCDGGTIGAAGPADGVAIADAVPLDGFLMPAVADRHVHIELRDPADVLRGGVTAVRDLGWPPERIFPLADVSELPTFDGPLIRAAGPILTARGGYPADAAWAPDGTARELGGPDDAEETVRELHGLGATAVKVSLHAEAGPTPTDAELMAVCDAAHALELPVTAHVQGRGQVQRAIGAGVDELAHAPWSERLSDDVVAAAARSLRIVSTLAIHERDPASLGVALDNVRRFRDAGGTLIYGTDLGNGDVPPGVVPAEVRLLRDAGMTPEEILGALVRAPIEPGAPADLLVLGGDPFDDVDALADVRLVVRAGRVVHRA